jgi:hypothetical protein
VVYRDYVDISVAVASPRGLVVPVIRNAQSLSFAQVEGTLGELAKKARADAISLEDMAGGTFTISNGGVFGSMLGTPIINPPQSAILGMHATKQRAVVINVSARRAGRGGAALAPRRVKGCNHERPLASCAHVLVATGPPCGTWKYNSPQPPTHPLRSFPSPPVRRARWRCAPSCTSR